MANLMNFDARVREVFENDIAKLFAFNKLMLDTAKNTFEEGISAKEASAKIVSMFKEIIGVDEHASKADILSFVGRTQKGTIVRWKDENGEEIEEFIPVEDEALEAKLIEVAMTKLESEDDLDDAE